MSPNQDEPSPTVPLRPRVAPATPSDGFALASIAEIAETLRQCPLLSSAQLAELGNLPAKFPDPRDLARELLARNWLTPYQANQLLFGRGSSLVLGPYVLLERLGEGGAGQVFKARHHKMNRLAAVKVLRPDLLAEEDVVARFYREIQIVSQLDHPNIVYAYDAGRVGATHFLAMEYVEGRDLARWVKESGRFPADQACAYICQAALGMQHAHARGLVHRDIKPHNLIVSLRAGQVKVADLGLARLVRAANSEVTAVLTGARSTGTLTPENSAAVIGTVDYMAPEQALDFHGTDIRGDIYSLGCTLFFLLTREPPFPGVTLAEKLVKHQQKPPPLERLRGEVPPALVRTLGKMLAKRPQDRFQTPGEVALALGSGGRSATASNPGVAPFLRRPRLITMAIALAGVAALVVVGLVAIGIRAWTGKENAVSDVVPSSITDRPEKKVQPPVTAGVYLSDLPETEVRVGWGFYGKKGKIGEYQRVTVKGVPSPNGLYMVPPSDGASHVSYWLGKKYQTLQGTAAIHDGAKPVTALIFKVRGNGKDLWQSQPLKGSSQPFTVSVAGIDKLELEVHCQGNNGDAGAVWVEPQLLPREEK
jgi:serine/threonine protein kinase